MGYPEGKHLFSDVTAIGLRTPSFGRCLGNIRLSTSALLRHTQGLTLPATPALIFGGALMTIHAACCRSLNTSQRTGRSVTRFSHLRSRRIHKAWRQANGSLPAKLLSADCRSAQSRLANRRCSLLDIGAPHACQRVDARRRVHHTGRQ